jgi:methylated-DNA-protein-cysteine methyltransferase-like protein
MRRQNVNQNDPDSLTERIVAVLRRVPYGRVTTYGQIAQLAGNPRAARQVARLLHSCSQQRQLPWHRVINAQGNISLAKTAGFELQQALLRSEGIDVSDDGRVDLKRYLWLSV